MSQRKTKQFGTSTWKKGSRGLLGPWATDQARIVDMRLALDGSLIPRPRFEEYIDLTSRTSNSAVVFPARYFDTSIPTYRDGYFIGDSTSCAFHLSGSASSFATGTGLAAVDTNTTITQISGTQWLAGHWLIDLKGTTGITVTNVFTALEAAFEPGTRTTTVNGSTVHQGRAFYWGTIYNASSVLEQANRIWYSDPYDYSVFTSATQFFDVDSDVEGCASVGSNLFIWTITGDWYVLQGRGDPADGTLNSLGKGRIPGLRRMAVRQDNALYFLASDKSAIVRVTEGGLIDDTSLGRLGFDADGEIYISNLAPTPTASSLSNSIYVPNDIPESDEFHARHLWNGCWTEETLSGSLSFTTSFVGTNESNNTEMLAHFVGGNWVINQRQILAKGPIEDVGAIVHAEEPEGVIGLPRIYDPMHPVRVGRVIIDGRYWKGGDYSNPTLGVTAVDGKGGTHTSETGPSADALATLPDGEGVPIRMVVQPASDGFTPWTHFVDLTIDSLFSIAIENVTVEYEVSNARNH